MLLALACAVTIMAANGESEIFRFPTQSKAMAFVREIPYGFPDLGEFKYRIECDPVLESKYRENKKAKKKAVEK